MLPMIGSDWYNYGGGFFPLILYTFLNFLIFL